MRVGLTVLAVAAVGSCGEQGPAGANRSAPVIESAARPPGTPLGDGYTVVDGTTLIGDPIPLGVIQYFNDKPVVDDGWTATSIVTDGQPLAIVQAYLNQAKRAGLVRQVDAGCGREQDVVICSAYSRSSDRAAPRSLAVDVVRGRRSDVVSNHVIVRYSTTDVYWDYGEPSPAVPSGVAVPPATSWDPLPGVGGNIGTAGETHRNLRIQKGSRLAGPVRLDLDDATGGFVAILEVTGDPRAVLDGYLRRLAADGVAVPPLDTRQLGSAKVTRATPFESGGDQFKFTLVERHGRPTWLTIEGSED